jgi:hypothetical protein
LLTHQVHCFALQILFLIYIFFIHLSFWGHKNSHSFYFEVLERKISIMP